MKNDKGDVYYFDNFKYVFSREIGNKSYIRVLNNSIGREHFCCVRYNGQSIIVENDDVKGIAEITSYFMTDEARQLISEEMKDNLGDFLLQISGNNIAYSKLLNMGSKIVIKKENGNILDSVPTNLDSYYSQSQSGNSFYTELESKVNYYELLDSAYSLVQEENFVGNSGPRRSG